MTVEMQVAPPAATRRRARVMKVLNVPMRAVLGLPFATPLGSRLMLVTHVGRKTGRTYRQPVSYIRHGNTLLTPGGGRWTRNLRDDEPVRLKLRGRDAHARPELVDDVGEVADLLTHMVSVNRRLASFVPFIGADGRVDPDRVAAAVEIGFRVVRWHLVGEATS